jgi:Leucine-rich repeat (LRR) protein
MRVRSKYSFLLACVFGFSISLQAGTTTNTVTTANYSLRLSEVLFSDHAFEKAVYRSLSYQVVNTNDISSIDVCTVTQLIIACNCKVASVSDLRFFPALERLFIGANKLSIIDLSGNTNLVSLTCYHNKLTELDVSKCRRLKVLNCSYNQLIGTLDLSSCNQFMHLYATGNTLNEVILPKNCSPEVMRIDNGVKVIHKDEKTKGPTSGDTERR